MNNTTAKIYHCDWRDHEMTAVDAIITDPPYGERCHAGQTHGRRDDDAGRVSGAGLGYDHWSPDDVVQAVELWDMACAGWIVALTSHDLIPAWEAAYESVGRYAFAPISCVMRGMNVRLAGDGPSNWTVYAMASRPRREPYSKWGALPGAYVGPPNRDGYRGGGKPLWLMEALVRDYSRHGDTIWDPCAGGGTTLVAALMAGRSAIGCEVDAETYETARARLASGYQQALV
jgi:site-specific DNA-methyltransferase (adenine-specific)